MNQAQMPHPSPEQLQAFVQGRLGPAELAKMELHVAACDVCCQVLRQVPDDTLIDRLRAVHAPNQQDTRPAFPAAPVLPAELRDHPHYRLIRPLGAGGMGVVYQAEHRFMERTVALKVINRLLIDDQLAVERFRQEVKAAAKLSHPNIVTSFDAGQAGDLHFLVMEYVEGISLAKYVEKKGPLPVVHACSFIRQAAQGLEHAAGKGMVHGDLKPQNLMLTRKGQVKILDFGLARLARTRGPVVVGDVSRPGLTAVGTVVGTPDYMAPEQAQDSRKVDVRADIYSLGCTLYFLLTGRPPFVGGSPLDKLLAHVSDPVKPVTEFRPDVPPELVQLLDRMMAKDPAQRFQTPAELIQSLTPLCQRPQSATVAAPTEPDLISPLVFTEEVPREPQRARPAPPGARRWLLPVGLSTLVLAAGVTSLVISSLAGKPGAPSNRFAAAGITGAQATSPEQPPTPVNPPGKATGQPRVLFVLPQKGFFWFDYAPVRELLEQDGVEVEVASSALTKAWAAGKGMERPEVQPDLLLSAADAKNYDAVIFAGYGVFTPGAESEFEAEGEEAATTRKFCEEMLKADRYVTALCGGVPVLADAGILKGKEFTGPGLNQSIRAKLLKAEQDGAKLLPDEVVVSGRVITGRDFKANAAFAQTLLARLKAERPSNPE